MQFPVVLVLSIIQDFDKMIQFKPDYAYAYYYRGAMKLLLQLTWEAKADLREAWSLEDQTGDEELKTKIEKALSFLPKDIG